MSMSMSAYYRASGKSSGLSVPLIFLGAMPAAALLAFIYAYAIVYIPIAGYITFLLSIGFGLGVGACAGFALRRGKVRSALRANLLGGLVALFAFYVHWVVWCYAVLQRADADISLAALFLYPPGLWEVITTINGTGAWTMKGFTPTGWVLWLFWSVEALLILVPAMLLPDGMIRQPFCEPCERWYDETQGVALLSPHDHAVVKARAEAKDFAALSSQGVVAATTPHHLRVDVWSCPRCRDSHTLSIHEVVRTTDDKGKESEKTNELVRHLLLSRGDVEKARSLAQLAAPSAPTMRALTEEPSA